MLLLIVKFDVFQKAWSFIHSLSLNMRGSSFHLSPFSYNLLLNLHVEENQQTIQMFSRAYEMADNNPMK